MTEFKVHIHNSGRENNNILTMIGVHNSGRCKLDIDVIRSYVESLEVLSDNDKIGYIFDEENLALDIWENTTDNFTLHIEEIETFNLDMAAIIILEPYSMN